MRRYNIKAVLFDVDGTLRNSVSAMHNAVNGGLRTFGHRELTLPELLTIACPPWPEFYAKIAPGTPTEDFQRAHDEHFDASKCELMPGAYRMIQEFVARRLSIGLITASKQSDIAQMLARFGLEEIFKPVITDCSMKAPVIKAFCVRHDLEPGEVAYVGDMPSDVRHGKEVGVVTFAVTFQPSLLPLVLREEPDYLVADLAKIPELVRNHARRS